MRLSCEAGQADEAPARPKQTAASRSRRGAPAPTAGPGSSTTPERLGARTTIDVTGRDREELMALRLARAVGPGDVGVGQRQEIVVVGVQEVGQCGSGSPRWGAAACPRSRGAAVSIRTRSRRKCMGPEYRASRDGCRVPPVFDIDAILRPWLDGSPRTPGRSPSSTRTRTSGQTTPTASSRRRPS